MLFREGEWGNRTDSHTRRQLRRADSQDNDRGPFDVGTTSTAEPGAGTADRPWLVAGGACVARGHFARASVRLKWGASFPRRLPCSRWPRRWSAASRTCSRWLPQGRTRARGLGSPPASPAATGTLAWQGASCFIPWSRLACRWPTTGFFTRVASRTAARFPLPTSSWSPPVIPRWVCWPMSTTVSAASISWHCKGPAGKPSRFWPAAWCMWRGCIWNDAASAAVMPPRRVKLWEMGFVFCGRPSGRKVWPWPPAAACGRCKGQSRVGCAGWARAGFRRGRTPAGTPLRPRAQTRCLRASQCGRGRAGGVGRCRGLRAPGQRRGGARLPHRPRGDLRSVLFCGIEWRPSYRGIGGNGAISSLSRADGRLARLRRLGDRGVGTGRLQMTCEVLTWHEQWTSPIFPLNPTGCRRRRSCRG